MTTIIANNKVSEFVSSIANENLPCWEKFSESRKKAKEILTQLDFPTTRNEYWKYSRVTKIARETYHFKNLSEEKIDLDEVRIPNLETYEIVFINGFISLVNSNLPSSDELEIVAFSDSKSHDYDSCFSKNLDSITNIFSALNTAYFTDGVLIKAKGEFAKPIHIIHYSTGENIISQPRNMFVSTTNSSLTILKSSINNNTNKFFQNSVNEFFLEKNSKLNFYVIQDYKKGMNVMTTNVVNQERDSVFSAYNYTIKGDWIRNNTNVFVNGKNCETNLFGAYQPTGSEHIDNHTLVDHLAAHCESNEHYKGTIADKATGVFNGKVFVRKDSQKINAFQSNNNVLLSDDATMNSKPELEIYADDVKCSHGSTSGQLDDEAVFYLQSRGLSKKSATALLIGAFLGEVVEKIEIPELKEKVLELYGME